MLVCVDTLLSTCQIRPLFKHDSIEKKDIYDTFPPSAPARFITWALRVIPVIAATNTGSCVGPPNKIDHPAG